MSKKTAIIFIVLLTVLAIFGCTNNRNYEEYKWESTPVLPNERITNLDFLNSNFGIGLVFNGNIIKTTDGGKSWNYAHVVDNENLVSLFFRNEDEFFVARNRLFKTVDGGDTFTELGVGEIDYMTAITGIHFKNDEEGVIIKAGRVFKTFDSGISWEPTYTEFGYAKQLKVFGDVLYIIGGITYHNRSEAEIHKSTDYGDTWEKVEPAESIRGHEIVASDFLDDATGFIITFDNKLYRTMDGSESWSLVNELPFDHIIHDVSFRDLEHGLITSSNKIYSTDDAGGSWNLEFEADQWLFNIERIRGNKVAVTGQNGMHFGYK